MYAKRTFSGSIFLDKGSEKVFAKRALSRSIVLDVEVMLYVHGTVGLLGTGAQDVHLVFHTAPEL